MASLCLSFLFQSLCVNVCVLIFILEPASEKPLKEALKEETVGLFFFFFARSGALL